MRTTFLNHHQSTLKKPTTMNPTRTRSLLVAVCLGLFDLMATTVQAGDTTEQPIKQLNEASDLIHWPEGFSPKQTDAFVHNQIFINAPAKVIWSNLVNAKDWPMVACCPKGAVRACRR
jgi:hypothetical protein